MIFGLFAVSDAFVPFFFGDGYDKVKILIPIISPILLFIGMSNVIGNQYLMAIRRQKEFTISVIIGAVVNLVLNSVMINRYGAFGASISTVIAEFCVTAFQMYIVRKEINLAHMVGVGWKYLVASLVMFGVCYIINIFSSEGISSIILKMVFGGLTYALVLFILKDRMVEEAKLKLKSRLRI